MRNKLATRIFFRISYARYFDSGISTYIYELFAQRWLIFILLLHSAEWMTTIRIWDITFRTEIRNWKGGRVDCFFFYCLRPFRLIGQLQFVYKRNDGDWSDGIKCFVFVFSIRPIAIILKELMKYSGTVTIKWNCS